MIVSLASDISSPDVPANPPDAAFAYEQTCLLAAQTGDYDSFGLLCDALTPGLYRYALRLVGIPDDAEDAVQLALISLHRHIQRIDPPTKLRAYVYRSVRNRCYDVLRASGRVGISLDDELVETWVSFGAADDAPGTDDAAHWLLLHLEVREAIDRLPEAQRHTLILYAEEGFTYAEIADIMGVTLGTVKSRLFHARAGLRGRMRPATLAALDDEFARTSDNMTTSEPDNHTERMYDGRDNEQTARKPAAGRASRQQKRGTQLSQRNGQRHG